MSDVDERFFVGNYLNNLFFPFVSWHFLKAERAFAIFYRVRLGRLVVLARELLHLVSQLLVFLQQLLYFDALLFVAVLQTFAVIVSVHAGLRFLLRDAGRGSARRSVR